MKITVVGAGNVATSLIHALNNKGLEILQIISRSEKNLFELAQKYKVGYTKHLSELDPKADIIILAVNDDSLKEVIDHINLNNQLIVHTSGSVSLDVFPNKFHNFGVFYPLQTFSKTKLVDFKNIPVCIEANGGKNLDLLKSLAGKISERTIEINSEKRRTLHIAAVFVSNFVNHMYSSAKQIMDENLIDFNILIPLIEETTKKILLMDPEDAQTGPARRNDRSIIKEHISILNNRKDLQILYETITQSIINQYFVNSK